MIRFENVSKAYLGGNPALQGLNFHLPIGSMTYVVGHWCREKYPIKVNYGHRTSKWR